VSAREILSIATGCGEPPAAEVRPGEKQPRVPCRA